MSGGTQSSVFRKKLQRSTASDCSVNKSNHTYHGADEDEDAVILEGIEDVPLVAPPHRWLELGKRCDKDTAVASLPFLILLLAVYPVQLANCEVVEEPETEQDAKQVAAKEVEEELNNEDRADLRGPTSIP